MNVTIFVLTVIVFFQPQEGLDVFAKVVQPVGVEQRIHSTAEGCLAHWDKISDSFFEQLVKIDGVRSYSPECYSVEIVLEGGKSA